MAKTKAMRLSRRLPHMLWKEIIGAAVYLYNKTLRQSLDWRTLYEVFQEYVISVQRVIGPRKPILYHLKVYAYDVYVFIKSKGDLDKPGKLQKLVPRAYIGYFVGYEFTNIYKV